MSSMTQTIVGSAIGHADMSILDRATSGCGPASEGLVARMRGVPKGALKEVLGKELGERVWRHARGAARFPESEIAEEHLVAGLICHLSRQAAVGLSQLGKHAKYVRLAIWQENGQSASARSRLARLTQDGGRIMEAAMSLFTGLSASSSKIRSVDLDVTAVGDAIVEPGLIPAPGASLAALVNTALGS